MAPRRPMLVALISAAACESPSPEPGAAPPTESAPVATPVELSVAPPWEVVHQDAHTVALRFDGTPHGIRVELGGDPRHPTPGVSLVVDGRTIGDPFVAVGHPDHPIRDVRISTEAHDAVVQFAGPPLADVTAHPDAPTDPVLTWVRVRPRNGSLRVVLDGLGTVAFPASAVVADEFALAVTGPEGTATLETNAALHQARLDERGFRFDTIASAEAADPYPRTGLTFRPASGALTPSPPPP
jgi:hypothetical protein